MLSRVIPYNNCAFPIPCMHFPLDKCPPTKPKVNTLAPRRLDGINSSAPNVIARIRITAREADNSRRQGRRAPAWLVQGAGGGALRHETRPTSGGRLRDGRAGDGWPALLCRDGEDGQGRGGDLADGGGGDACADDGGGWEGCGAHGGRCDSFLADVARCGGDGFSDYPGLGYGSCGGSSSDCAWCEGYLGEDSAVGCVSFVDGNVGFWGAYLARSVRRRAIRDCILICCLLI